MFLFFTTINQKCSEKKKLSNFYWSLQKRKVNKKKCTYFLSTIIDPPQWYPTPAATTDALTPHHHRPPPPCASPAPPRPSSPRRGSNRSQWAQGKFSSQCNSQTSSLLPCRQARPSPPPSALSTANPSAGESTGGPLPTDAPQLARGPCSRPWGCWSRTQNGRSFRAWAATQAQVVWILALGRCRWSLGRMDWMQCCPWWNEGGGERSKVGC